MPWQTVRLFLLNKMHFLLFACSHRGHRGRDRMVVGIYDYLCYQSYHHWSCELESLSGRGVQYYVIKFVSDLRQVGFSPSPLVSSTNKTDRYVITEIVLKVALNTINQTSQSSFWIIETLRNGAVYFCEVDLFAICLVVLYPIPVSYLLWCISLTHIWRPYSGSEMKNIN